LLSEVVMSYQVLARKWRPQVFEDVIGQGHITRTLQNAISSNRLAHAFLFSGPRGVGKTTTARILAKALNCAEGPTPSPCGKCDSCRETTAGTSVDVIEIDGASNRGIEHIRELREAVKYSPVGGKYKVYVIDEVHMLTNEAFNALLKTLEEPPPHVMFIFATTEPQKIPATIHSRCQRYGFKRVAIHEIMERLRTICTAEGIAISDAGLAMIARAAEGSMRDSQSLLDQAVSYSGMTIKDDDLQVTLGVVAQEALLRFTGLLLGRDSAGLLHQVDALQEHGQDMRRFLGGAIEHIRNLLVVRNAADPGKIIELPAADIDAIKRQSEGADSGHLLLLFDTLSKTLDEMRWSPHQRFTLEIGLIRSCSLAPLQPLSEVLAQVRQLEARISSGAPSLPAAPAQRLQVNEPRQQYASSAPAAPVRAASGDVWQNLLAHLKAKKPGLFSALEHSRLLSATDAELVIEFFGSSFQQSKVEDPESRALIEQVAGELTQKTMRVKFQAAGPAPKAEKQKPAHKPTHAPDPAVQDVLSVFTQGTVVDPEKSS
jgi:DNA polymerase-3 subunit gamma/tau